ncbi:MAG: glycosyltransferase family 2 protein [Pseudomonadota bacterium]
MTVAIILVNWNGWEDTIECLESVFRLDYHHYRVIVVDNASANNSLAFIKEWAEGKRAVNIDPNNPLSRLSSPPLPKPVPYVELTREAAERGDVAAVGNVPLVLIQSGENLGFAGGNNIGLRLSLRMPETEYAWLLNNDTVVEPGALSALVKRSRAVENCGIVGSTLLFYSDPDTVQALGGATFNKWRAKAKHIGALSKNRELSISELDEIERTTAYPIGASMLVGTAFLRDVGLMEESYFLYYEELDWVCRGLPHYRAAYAADSLVYHKVGKSAGDESPMSWHFLCRSRLLFMKRHYSQLLPVLYAVTVWELFKALIKGRKAEQRAHIAVLRNPEAWPSGAYRPSSLCPPLLEKQCE